MGGERKPLDTKRKSVQDHGMPDRVTVALPDIHIPHEDRDALRVVSRYLSDSRQDDLVILGDFMDFEEISRFVEGKPRKIEGVRLAKNAERGRQVMAALCKAARKVNPNCRVHLLEGNHEYRMQALLDAQPIFEELVEVPKLLDLDGLGVKWVKSWSESEVLAIGDAHFIHGWFVPKYHAFKHVSELMCTVYTGHTHDVQEIALPRHGGPPLVGKSLGCLCKLKQGYTHGRPRKWQHAFGVLYHWGNTHQEFTVKLANGRFMGPNGKEYRP